MAMDWWMLALNGFRVIIAVLVLGVASYHDINTRSVANRIWVIFGLIGISLFEIQIIFEYEIEAFPYLILTLPITALFMSFLVCDWVIDFEVRKFNQSWILLIVLVTFSFIYLTQFSVLELNLDLLLIGPLVLFLLFFTSMEVIMNYMDFKTHLRIIQSTQAKEKAHPKKGKHVDRNFKPTKTILPQQSADERFAWSLFIWLLLFHILAMVFYILVPIVIAKIIALIVMVCIPIVLIALYEYHQIQVTKEVTSEAKSSTISKQSKSEKEDTTNDSDELVVMDKDLYLIQRLKYLNLLLSVGLIVFGFLLIIYYSAFVTLPDIMLQAFAIMIWIIIFYGFYNLSLPRGGADTKALMALMILFPLYPIFENITLQTSFYTILTDLAESGIAYIFPFAFTVLMNAALIMIVVIICFLIFNISKRDLKFPHAVLGYKMKIQDIQHKFVWPLERLVEGKRKLMVFPGSEKEVQAELKKFKTAGITQIWVTPKIPFIIPITIGIILTIILGNILFELVLMLV